MIVDRVRDQRSRLQWVVFLFSTPFVFAQSVTVEFETASQYIFRGQELGDLTFHPSVEFGQGNLYGGVWAALPLENDEVWNEEYDFYLGHGWALNGDVSLDLGGIHYYYPSGGDTTELYLGLAGDIQSIATSFYIYNDLDLDTWTGEARGSYAFPFFDKVMELGAYAGAVQGGGSEDYLYYGLDAEVIFEINSKLSFLVGGHLADNDLGGSIGDSRFFGTLTLTAGW
ncbi:MAG: TorF family putative porin [Verrucomicrobiota bacterium]